MDLRNISDKQLEEAVKHKTPESILAFAQSEGIELSDEQLDQVAGGGIWDDSLKKGCPECGSMDFSISNVGHIMWYKCRECGYKWA